MKTIHRNSRNGSGSGKTTIAHQLETHGFERLITTTTRSMREGEVNHHDYHFVSKEEFKISIR